MIYTKKGDCGLSATMTAEGISKDDILFELLGSIDELGSFLGLARACLSGSVADKLEQIQLELVQVSSHIAGGSPFDYKGVAGNYEVFIDSLTPIIDMPDRIIISGDCDGAAYIDVCRAVARRCERRAVTFVRECSFDSCLVAYLNRLSDYLFMLSLFAKKLQK